jgi:signal transduction histidine kinase/CheY-like chemotaxis protein
MIDGNQSGERILLVDDDEAVLETLKSILEQEGYHIVTAASGEEAIAQMNRAPFDLVLSDLKMEGISGLEVLAHAQKRWPRPATILLTGYASIESAVGALHRGAYGYLVKPCGIEELKHAIKEGLEKKRLSEVEILYQTAKTLISTLNLDKVLNDVLREASRVTGFSRSLFLLYRDREERIVTDQNAGAAWIEAVSSFLKKEKGLREQMEKGEIVMIPREEKKDPKEERILSRLKVKTLLAIPLLYQSRLRGVLYLDNEQVSHHFTRRDIHLVLGLADLTALTIQNADLFEELQRTNQGLHKTKLALEQANRELKSLDQMKTNILSNVSHELKTPMVAVKGYTSLVAKGKAGPIAPLQKEYLEIALRNVQKQLSLIDELLDFSKLGITRDTFLLESLDLTEVLDESLRVIQPKAVEKKVNLEIQTGSEPCWVLANRLKIGQVLNNLLSNAVKFTPEGGKITVTFKKQKKGKVNVSVGDTGIGIPVEMQEKIFDRFYQVESSESRRFGGIGLGLAIAQSIVKGHGSHIHVTSKAGKGARFTFSLATGKSALG